MGIIVCCQPSIHPGREGDAEKERYWWQWAYNGRRRKGRPGWFLLYEMAKFRPGSRSKLLFLLVYEMAIICVCVCVCFEERCSTKRHVYFISGHATGHKTANNNEMKWRRRRSSKKMRTITACDRCLYPIKASTVFFFPYISFLPSFVSFFSLLFSSTAAAAVVQFRKKESVKRRRKRYVHVSGQAHMFPFQLISNKISMPKNTFRKCSFSGVCAVRAFFHRYSFAFCSCCFWTFLFSFTSSFSRRSRIDRSVACLPACIEKRERKRERWNGWPKRLFTWPAQPKEMKKNMLNRRTFLKKREKKPSRRHE